jgi:hypothetical protein
MPLDVPQLSKKRSGQPMVAKKMALPRRMSMNFGQNYLISGIGAHNEELEKELTGIAQKDDLLQPNHEIF